MLLSLGAVGLWLLSTAGPAPAEEQLELLLIDDFTRDDERSALGTRWRYFADRVMGGVSDGDATRERDEDDRPYLRLKGVVSLDNNGGFIQVRLPLAEGDRPTDQSAYTGVRLTVRGNGEEYYLHLRTADTFLPWQFYTTKFRATDEWETIDLPFDEFVPESLNRGLRTDRVISVAVVAMKKAMDADVGVAHIEFYR